MEQTPHPDEEPAPEQATGPTQPLAGGETPTPRRLTRAADDRVLGGVAGGLGRYFGVDPILFRVAFVVLTFAGGIGALAYLALWLLVPTDGSGEREPDRSRTLVILGAAALVIAALALFHGFGPGLFFFAPGLVSLAVLVAVAVLLWRSARQDGQGSPAARRLLLIIAATLLALVGGLAAAVASAAGGGTVVAALVIAVGAVMVVAAFAGGARWLILPAFVLAVPLALVSAADIDLTGGFGERQYRPTSTADLRPGYELGAGELVIDLSDVTFPPGRTDMRVRVGMGHVMVRVPREVCVTSRVRLGAGWAGVLDRENGGLDVDWREAPTVPARTPRLHIDADIGMGALEVGDDRFAFERFGRRHFGRGPQVFDGRGENAACRGGARGTA
jgi:phage shock protein PspC (stress-responsive transcriptional regulator)/predicted membrane protein